MTQSERREYLIEYLLKNIQAENAVWQRGTGESPASLMMSECQSPAREEFLRVQDEYLKERNAECGITDIAGLKPVSSDERMYIWQGDIGLRVCKSHRETFYGIVGVQNITSLWK